MKKLTVHSIPALIVASLFAIGILVGRKLELPLGLPVAVTTGMLLVAITFLVLANKNSPLNSFLTISLIILIICSGIAKIQYDMFSSPSYQIQSNRVVEIVGRIIEPATTSENKTRFTLNAESITDSSGTRQLPTNILVTVVRRKKDTTNV